MAGSVNRTTISECVQPEGKTSWRTRGFSHTQASAQPAPRASQGRGWASACGGRRPGARGGGGRAAECPRTKAPPEAWAQVTCCLQEMEGDRRRHWEAVMLFIFGKSIRPTLQRAFCPSSLGAPSKCTSRPPKSVVHRPLRAEAAPPGPVLHQ